MKGIKTDFHEEKIEICRKSKIPGEKVQELVIIAKSDLSTETIGA